MNKSIIIVLLVILFVFKGYFGTNLYLDNSNFPLTFNDYIITVKGLFSSISSGSYFGYDNTSLHTTRWLGIIMQGIGMFPLFLLYFFCNFYFSKELLKIYFPDKSATLGALFFSFNPVSIYYLSVSGFLFNYTSIVIILYAIYKLYSKPYKIKYICLFIIGCILFLSYTRSIGIYGIILLSLVITYRNLIYIFIKKHTIIFGVVVFLTIFAISPFLFSIFYPIISGENIYFSGLGNYADVGRNWGNGLYNQAKNKAFVFHMLPSEILTNFAHDFQNNSLFKSISFIFILTTTCASFMFKPLNNKAKNILFTLQILFLLCIFIIGSAAFLPSKLFVTLYYDFFPFLANNLRWIYLIYVFVIAFFVALAHMHLNGKKQKIYKALLYLYIGIILSPILFFNNSKVQLINNNSIPSDYGYFSKTTSQEAAIFSPYDYRVLYDWAPYPLNLNFARSQYKTPFQNNSRTVTNKQLNLYNVLSNSINSNVENLKILNIKNFFVFNNVINTNVRYDFFKKKDYILESELQTEFLKNHENISLIENNEIFSHYHFKDSNEFDFLLYAPGKIQEIKSVFNLYEKSIDINDNPLIIDSQSFQAPTKINLDNLNKDLKIDYKKNPNDATKYFLKISNLNNKQNFVIHLNQTFGTNWKLKWINKTEYEKYPCNSNAKYHEKTNNSSCEINNYTILNSLKDYQYKNYPELKNSNHFEGNLVGNSWIIEDDDIAKHKSEDGNLYAVIIYEKQFWHIFFMSLSISVIGILILIAFFQETINYISRKTRQ